jgi:hypothetical protein
MRRRINNDANDSSDDVVKDLEGVRELMSLKMEQPMQSTTISLSVLGAYVSLSPALDCLAETSDPSSIPERPAIIIMTNDRTDI